MASSPKIAMVTCQKVPSLSEGDQITWLYLQSRGIQVSPAIWDDPSVNWTNFDMVIIRSVWDYVEKYAAFIQWLKHIEDAGVKVLNPIPWLRWNLEKTYLQDLKEKNWPVIPTRILKKPADLSQLIIENDWQEAVLKPVISAGAYQTYRFDGYNAPNYQEKLNHILERCPALLQPLRKEIMEYGEYSLVFFNNQYSHTVCKKAKADEFRVNVEYEGTMSKFNPPEPWIELASKLLRSLNEVFLYARIDMVPVNGNPELIELELVEPNLLTHLDATDAERFGEAILAHAQKTNPKNLAT